MFTDGGEGVDIYEHLKNNFHLFKKQEYSTCNLSVEDKNILCEIGLPELPLDFIHFDVKDIENIIYEEYVIIGGDNGTYICINEKGNIVSVDKEQEYPTRFVNINLESLLKFILVFWEYQDVIINAEDEELYTIIKQIRYKFDSIDIQALSDEENWWAIILEQIEQGLM